MRHYLDFEKPIAELEGKIEELRRMSEPDGINIAEEVSRLTAVADRQLRLTYAKLTPWQKTLVARHPDRPKAMDYIAALISDFTPLAGDRAFAEDAAVLGGLVPIVSASVEASATLNPLFSFTDCAASVVITAALSLRSPTDTVIVLSVMWAPSSALTCTT